MKNAVKLKSSLFAGLLSLLLLFPSFGAFKLGELKEITKPYLGVYECKAATLGDEDVLSRFAYVNIELKKGDVCTLYYREKNGKRKEVKGKYSYDKEAETITLSPDVLDFFKREFPLKDGEILISLPMGGKMLSMRFVQK